MARPEKAGPQQPRREPYEPGRVRPLSILLWVVVALGVLLGAIGVRGLLSGQPVGLVILVALVPALVLLTLASWSRGLVRQGDPGARVAVPVTATVTAVVGLLYSQAGAGILIAVVGVLLLLVALLPSREDASSTGSGGR